MRNLIFLNVQIVTATPAVLPSTDQMINFQNDFNENQAMDEGVQNTQDITDTLSMGSSNYGNASKFPINVLEVDQNPNANKKPKNMKTKTVSSQAQGLNHLIRIAPNSQITEKLEVDQNLNVDKKPKNKKTKKISSQTQSVNRLSRPARTSTTS